MVDPASNDRVQSTSNLPQFQMRHGGQFPLLPAGFYRRTKPLLIVWLLNRMFTFSSFKF
jgi:hypothetical protein